jgi:probable H4MPT-linked C1 transfer pathway protein
MRKAVIGWDVGGAHLKAAMLNADGELQQVLQVPCALWRGLDELEKAIDIVLNAFSTEPVLHAITMTGELVDLFQSRQQGVQSICKVMAAKLHGEQAFYSGAANADLSAFVSLSEVEGHWQHIASANWLASASVIGKLLESNKAKNRQKAQHALLIDIGSTTSDFVLFENDQPVCLGFTDAARMQSEELVYTGVVRTPLMAVAQKVQFENKQTSVAAEYFATTADVYRLTGDLLAEDDMADTADGQDKSVWSRARRLARMIGHDVEYAETSAWLALAQEFKTQQLLRLKNIALQHIARLHGGNVSLSEICLVGAGAGAFLAKEIASELHVRYLDIAELIEVSVKKNMTSALSHSETSRLARVCLPAYAVAYLAFHQQI